VSEPVHFTKRELTELQLLRKLESSFKCDDFSKCRVIVEDLYRHRKAGLFAPPVVLEQVSHLDDKAAVEHIVASDKWTMMLSNLKIKP
jgi:hypothetical protein